MSAKSKTIAVMRAVLLGSAFAASASGETSMTVMRCNADVDGNGVYQPVLQVAVNGETHVYPMGSDGLTRSIVFNAEAAIAWAVGLHAADATDVIFGLCYTEGSDGVKLAAVETDTDGGDDSGTGGNSGNDTVSTGNDTVNTGNDTFDTCIGGGDGQPGATAVVAC